MTPEQLRKQRDRLREMMQRCRIETQNGTTPEQTYQREMMQRCRIETGKMPHNAIMVGDLFIFNAPNITDDCSKDNALGDPTPTPPKRRYTVRATIRSIRRGKPTPFMEDEDQ